jgi:hypothetical protein
LIFDFSDIIARPPYFEEQDDAQNPPNNGNEINKQTHNQDK